MMIFYLFHARDDKQSDTCWYISIQGFMQQILAFVVKFQYPLVSMPVSGFPVTTVFRNITNSCNQSSFSNIGLESQTLHIFSIAWYGELCSSFLVIVLVSVYCYIHYIFSHFCFRLLLLLNSYLSCIWYSLHLSCLCHLYILSQYEQ